MVQTNTKFMIQQQTIIFARHVAYKTVNNAMEAKSMVSQLNCAKNAIRDSTYLTMDLFV